MKQTIKGIYERMAHRHGVHNTKVEEMDYKKKQQEEIVSDQMDFGEDYIIEDHITGNFSDYNYDDYRG